MVTRTENVFVRRRRVELQLVARIPCMHHSSSSHHNTVTTFPALASQRVSLETAADNVWLDRMLRCCTAAPELTIDLTYRGK